MSRTLKIAGTITLLLLLAAFSMAAANAQTYPQPTNVTAENTTDGHVLVSWADDAAPVHRVGWTHDADFRAAEAAGDWLEAFHFARLQARHRLHNQVPATRPAVLVHRRYNQRAIHRGDLQRMDVPYHRRRFHNRL